MQTVQFKKKVDRTVYLIFLLPLPFLLYVLIGNFPIGTFLRAAIGLRAALGNFLLHQNSSLFAVTFEEKVLNLAKSQGLVHSCYCIYTHMN